MTDDRQYLQFFTLTARPFYDLQDPRFVWMGEKQLETLKYLKNGVEQRKGIILLTGADGAGKSVLVDQLIRCLPGDTITVVMREPGLEARRFEELVSEWFSFPLGKPRGEFQKSVSAFLEQAYLAGKYVLIVVEDAETAEDEAFEQIRLLSNAETPDGEKLLSILITGNGRLEERLSSYDKKALQQRVEVRRAIGPFTAAETSAYIRHRMMVSGGFLEIFIADAVERVHHFSGGVPKLIDFICDHALKRACLEKKRQINGQMVDNYATEIRATSPIGLKGTGDKKQPLSRLAALPVLTLAIIVMLGFCVYLVQRNPKPQVPEHAVLPPGFSLKFEPRSVMISDSDFKKLGSVAEYLIANRNSHVVIRSLPGTESPSAYDKRLASARRESVKNYFVSKGVPVTRVSTILDPTPRQSISSKKENSIEIELLPY
jgi:type II secretory pathway predicted ATPase ExeA